MARFNFGKADKEIQDLGRPVEVIADKVCRNCTDAYSEAELVGGKCFGCRLDRHRKGHRLEIKPSWSGAETLDFKQGGL